MIPGGRDAPLLFCSPGLGHIIKHRRGFSYRNSQSGISQKWIIPSSPSPLDSQFPFFLYWTYQKHPCNLLFAVYLLSALYLLFLNQIYTAEADLSRGAFAILILSWYRVRHAHRWNPSTLFSPVALSPLAPQPSFLALKEDLYFPGVLLHIPTDECEITQNIQ